MPKALCLIGLVVAGLVFLLFLLDIAIGLFYKASIIMDIMFSFIHGGFCLVIGEIATGSMRGAINRTVAAATACRPFVLVAMNASASSAI